MSHEMHPLHQALTEPFLNKKHNNDVTALDPNDHGYTVEQYDKIL
jgi:hypothetical protein